MTPAIAQQINSHQGLTSGSFTFPGGYQYAWTNLALNANAVSLELVVDPGLHEAARAIDSLNQNLPQAYDPFYVAAAGNPEAALNQLVGREINQAIDTNEVNQGTTFAYEVLNHLDSVSQNGVGGIDVTGLQVGSAGLLAFAGTDAQLESLLRAGPVGGVEMSTDRTDMKQMAAARTDSARWGAWASGTVTLANEASQSALPGYHATTGNPTIGIDFRLAPHLVVGALAAYSGSDLSFGDGSHLGTDTALGGLYASYHPSKWSVNALVAGGYTKYDIDRATFGSMAEAHPEGSQAIADVTGGYDINLTRDLLFKPELGVTYTYVGVDSYQESGAGAFDLNKGEQDINSLRSHIGGRLTDAITAFGGSVVFLPQLRASYYHEFMDNNSGVSTSLPGATGLGSFAVSNTSPERDFALVGLGLDTKFTGAGLPMGAFIDYDVQVGQSDYLAHNISAGFRVNF